MKHFFKKTYYLCERFLWYVSLWGVFTFFIKEWRAESLYLASLSATEKQEISKTKWTHRFWFFISITLHIILFLGIITDPLDLTVVHTTNQVIVPKIVNFTLETGTISPNLNNIYDKNSEFIINKKDLIIEKRKNDLKTLLDKLHGKKKFVGLKESLLLAKDAAKNTHHSNLDKEEAYLQGQLRGSHNKFIINKTPSTNAQLWNNINLLKGNSKGVKVNYTKIMQVIDKHRLKFRECYEKALLKDESLSVKGIFIMRLKKSIVASTKIKLQGKGNKKSYITMSNCLRRVSKKLLFLKNKHNITIKFNLIFGRL